MPELPDIFWLFLLAHLTGDFLLQTSRIASLKLKSRKGLLLHAGLVSAAQILFLVFYGMPGLCAALAAGIFHFFIDSLKALLNPYLKRKQFIYFLLDQAVHFAGIYFFTRIFLSGQTVFSGYMPWIRTALGWVTVLSISTVAAKILVRDLFPGLSGEAFFKRFERGTDAVSAFLLYILWMFPAFLSIILVVLLFPAYKMLQDRKFGYSSGISAVKYAVLTVAGCSSFLFAANPGLPFWLLFK